MWDSRNSWQPDTPLFDLQFPTTILSTPKPGLASACMHQRPKSLRIVGKLLDMTLLYACASSYFCLSVSMYDSWLDREGIIWKDEST
jgi:hypothetical protein